MGNSATSKLPPYYTFASIIENNAYRWNHKSDVWHLESPPNSLYQAHMANF